MPDRSHAAPLVWDEGLRPPPPEGTWRRVARFRLTGPGGAPRQLAGYAGRRAGVTLFVADGLERERIAARIWPALAACPARLAAPTRQVLVAPAGAFADGYVGLANRRREIWLTDGAQVLTRSGMEVSYVIEHELAHNAGGSDGGAPDDLREQWAAAIAADRIHAREHLLAPGADGAHPAVPMQIGRAGVTAYAEAMGRSEDWAEAVALHGIWRRSGAFVGAQAAALIAGRPRELSFADCYPNRAAILGALL